MGDRGSSKASSGADGPGEERAFETTALIDATSMEGLQARSRSGSSMPPPPVSDAQPTSVLDTNKLSELVGESGTSPVKTTPAIPVQSAPDATETVRPAKASVQGGTSSRSKYTPTLRSVDFDGQRPRAALWPLLIGVVVFGAGVGTFLGTRTMPTAPVADEIELSVKVEPKAASLRLDGQPLQGNPHTSKHPRDGKRHDLVVEAAGHQPQTLEVVFDSSTVIDLALPKTSDSK